MTRNDKHRYASLVAYCAATAASLFLAVPLFMIGDSLADFTFIDFKALLLSGALLAIGTSAALLIVFTAFAEWRSLATALHGARFLFWWVILAGLLLPVSVSSGMVDAAAAKVDVIHLFSVAVLAGLFVWLQRTSARQYVLAFVIVFVMFTVGTSVMSIVQSDATWRAVASPSEAPESTNLSANNNVLVISLDGLQGHIVADLLRSDLAIAEGFKDFTLFENTLSQSPATQASMVGELFGVRDYKSMGDTLDDVKAALADNGLADSIPLLAAEDAFQKHYPFGNDAGLDQSQAAVTADSVEFLKFALARVATRFAVNNGISDSSFEALVSRFAREGSDELATRLRSHAGPDWDKRYVAEIHEFDAFTHRLSRSDKPTSYRYLHFAFTHYPVDFDEHCQYQSDDRRWFGSNQNIAGLKNESRCALSKLQIFLQRLKALDIYDESLLVFKSDHGHPTNYFAEPPYNLEINKHTLWGYSRYRPLMMVKPRNASQEHLAIRSELVLLNDLAKTICVHGDDANNCAEVPGQDLLGDEPSEGGYYLYVVPSRASSFTFDSHISVPVPSRSLDPVEALRAAEGVELRAGGASPD